MKKFFLILFSFSLSLSVFSQGGGNGNNTNNIVERQIIEICDGQSECIDSWDSLLENSCQISDSEECRKVKLKINELFNGLEDFSVGSGNGNNDEETLIGSSAT